MQYVTLSSDSYAKTLENKGLTACCFNYINCSVKNFIFKITDDSVDINHSSNLSLVARKPVFGVSDQV